MTSKIAEQAAEALDMLAALSVELACHCDAPPDRLVLGAGKLKEPSRTIDDAVESLKRILVAAEAREGPLVDDRPEG